VGDLVKRGQKVAEVGNSGRTTGSHLHFEVLVQGIPQDPQKFLNQSPLQQGTQVAIASGSPNVRAAVRIKSAIH
jgi:murein DD-endopeptidase MepM/ murein hydrolase activator NlpD